MMKNLTSAITKAVLALSACAALNANAGTAVAAKTVAEDKDESLFALAGIDMTGTMEVGWDSRYYFRGLWFADHTAWGGFSASVPLKGISDKLTFNFGALYTSNVETKVNSGLFDEKLEYSELDLIGSLIGIVGFERGFHGRTLGSQQAGGMAGQKAWIVNEDPAILNAPFPDGYWQTDT
ncbi:MAG: hypothetical protein RLZZ253_2942, partial [Verrucomicrobiota bacterium]